MTAHQTRTHSRTRSPLGGIAAALSVALVLAGCGSPGTQSTATTAPANESVSAAPAAGAFPRSITVPAGAHTDAATVTVDAEPKRVAALTFETAALVAALGAGDRLVSLMGQTPRGHKGVVAGIHYQRGNSYQVQVRFGRCPHPVIVCIPETMQRSGEHIVKLV